MRNPKAAIDCVRSQQQFGERRYWQDEQFRLLQCFPQEVEKTPQLLLILGDEGSEGKNHG